MTTSSKKELYLDRSSKPHKITWTALVAKYQISNPWQSIGQAVNTFIPFFVLWSLMVLSLDYSYWLTLGLALPAAGLLVRIFIIQHDCGHGSFFKQVVVLTLWSSFKTIFLSLWDEDQGQLVSFGQLKSRRLPMREELVNG